MSDKIPKFRGRFPHALSTTSVKQIALIGTQKVHNQQKMQVLVANCVRTCVSILDTYLIRPPLGGPVSIERSVIVNKPSVQSMNHQATDQSPRSLGLGFSSLIPAGRRPLFARSTSVLYSTKTLPRSSVLHTASLTVRCFSILTQTKRSSASRGSVTTLVIVIYTNCRPRGEIRFKRHGD